MKRILTFAKIFLTFVLYFSLISILLGLVISIIKYPHHIFDVEYYKSCVHFTNIITCAAVCSFIDTPKYIKKAIIISMDTVEEAKGLFINFSEALSEDKWKANNKGVWSISFSLLSIKNMWREKILLELLENSVRVSGSKIYIEKVFKKVGFELSM